ncbi:MAG: hypothetical protein B5766_12965 [Candidatus Lumbricidophila eiseniae]|uniref:Peptidoglycan binding-like domain-containing protein n=1 Tax=Candidatus Lumbricidiphila eiseniae TaxID=1969409 RepID=A0A2A6FN78_9MICO|nr:MAG: hypothetical protein B5766_12965 [Candidatus Lumbricidophila eiseniae]
MSRTAEQALAWAHTNPTRDGGTWSQWCQSFIVRALNLTAAGDAHIACRASTIISTQAQTAPPGALHWWLHTTRASGHVGISLGNHQILMTDAPAPDQWAGHNTVGITTEDRYRAKGTAYRYIGWSQDMAGQPLTLTTTPPETPPTTPPQNSPGLPYTTTTEDGQPGPIFWQRFQLWASKWGYTGPIDGDPGPHTWTAIQNALREEGYTGPTDGDPGPNTWRALQRVAAKNGYTGPIDGDPGPNTWRGLARFLNTL